MCKFAFIILYVVLVCYGVIGDDFLGCGGFVKSDVDIDYSRIVVKLYTAHGSIKYETDCAPNNGYYLIPVYDKGDFILKVEPPDGWSFDPTTVTLHIDGTSDKCSRGEDINFVFLGFTLSGQVISSGLTVGPSDVDIHMYRTGSETPSASTKSGNDGIYQFNNVMPGEYEVKAIRKSWAFEKDVNKVTISKGNIDLGGSLVVAGYPVQGTVYSEKEPIKGVKFVLFSRSKIQTPIKDCVSKEIPGFSTNESLSPLCHVVSTDAGIFHFPVLPSGSYFIIPFYKGEHITFDVIPDRLEFNVLHSPVTLPVSFEVAGFSVSGRVLEAVGGKGVRGATVHINNKVQCKTEEGGVYHLENMKTGMYSVDIKADGIKFIMSTVKITPNTPQLPDLVAHSFQVCGSVSIDQWPETLTDRTKQTVTFSATTSIKVVTVQTDLAGRFCVYLQPAPYSITVTTTEREIQAGLKIIPIEQSITVTNRPIDNIKFTQFRSSISGVADCLEGCGEIQVSLENSVRTEKKQHLKLNESTKLAKYVFKHVLPGKYRVNLLHDKWCWKEKSVDTEMIDKDVSGVDFRQTGYIFKCTLSHEITLHFAHTKKPEIVGSFSLNRGTNRFCLGQAGLYQLTPDSCHRFSKPVYMYDTSQPVPLTLTAVEHLVTGRIISDSLETDIYIHIKSVSTAETITIGPIQSLRTQTASNTTAADNSTTPVDQDTPVIYNFSYWAKTGDQLVVSASSQKLLFQPKQLTVVIKGDKCPGEMMQFTTKKGLFIHGGVDPPLAGMKVVITSADPTIQDMEFSTDVHGKYTVGPLDPELEYTADAALAGYTIEKVKGQLGKFKAFKLAEINVQVVDKDHEPLSNVLLSLSGGIDYRSNNLTTESGSMQFISLHPGQYYLRAMMKEYKFEPPSRMLDIGEASMLNITIQGVRVAFSCIGDVISLNGEPESNLVVEAVGVGSACTGLQEESKTDQHGIFRVRGVQPNCEYSLRIQASPVNDVIDRSAPKDIPITVTEYKDISQLRFIAFRRSTQVDVSGNVVTEEKFFPSLKVKLYSGDNPDTPLHTVSLATSAFFYFPYLPIEDKLYTIQMESTLSKTLFDYDIPPIKFYANTSHQHFTMHFSPRTHITEQDYAQSSVIFLPLMALIMVAIYNRQIIFIWLQPYIDELMREGYALYLSLQNRPPPASPTNMDFDSTLDALQSRKKPKSRKT